MKQEWHQITIGDLGKVVTGNTPPKNDPENYGGKYPFIKPTDMVKDQRYVFDYEETYSEKAFRKFKNAYIPPFSTGVVTIGTVGEKLFLSHEWCFTNQSVNVIIPDEEKYDKMFVYYLMKYNLPQVAKANPGTASGRHHVSKSNFCSIQIEVPPLLEQQKIAFLLSTYDDLIENNNRRIAIHEEMARSLYREWFVKFRFPGHEVVKMIDSELGQIPEGWEIKETADLLKRLTVKAKYTQENVEMVGSIPVIDQSRDEVLGFHDHQADVVANNDFPIAIFGDHTCKMQLLVEPFSIGPNVIPFTSKIDRPMQYVFYLVNSLVTTKEYKRHWTELISKEVVVAPQNITENFSNLIKPLLAQINLLKKKNYNLKTQRDMLLPKLISGKIEV